MGNQVKIVFNKNTELIKHWIKCNFLHLETFFTTRILSSYVHDKAPPSGRDSSDNPGLVTVTNFLRGFWRETSAP